MQTFSPKAIFLDFYGTVVEEDDIYIAKICNQITYASPLNPAKSEVGSYWNRSFKQLCSDSFRATFKTQKEIERLSLEQVLQHFRSDLDSQELSQILFDYWAKPDIFSESKNMLAQCPVPICVVSNIDKAEFNSALEYNNLSFDHVVTSEDCCAYKPCSAMFDRALSLLGLHPADVLHVGDSLGSDVRGAKSLDMPVLWINRKNRQASSDNMPDYTATDLTGLNKFFQT